MTVVRKLISLGTACEVAFQLRQHSGDSTGHYFDWLFTPIEGLIHVIDNDFPAFRQENLSLRRSGRTTYVIDSGTGIGFAHQFPRRGKVIREDFLENYPAFAGKCDYLAARFRETLRTCRVCLVRRKIFRSQALQLEDTMRRRFPDADFSFLYVNAERETFSTPLGRSIFLPDATSAFGDSIAWARLLKVEALVERPFRLSTAQIVRSSSGDNHLDPHETQAAATLAEARRVNPENPWFAHELGRRELAGRKFRRAAELAEEALARDSENPDFMELRLRARLGARLVSPQAALAEAISLLDRGSHSHPRELAVDLLIERGQLAEALSLVDRGLERRADADELHLRRARVLLLSGRAAEAEAAVDTALALHPAGKAYVELKAKILCNLGRADEASALVRQVLRKKRSYRLQILRVLLALRLGERVYRQPSILAESPRRASVP